MTKIKLISDIYIDRDNYDSVIKLFETDQDECAESIILLAGNVGVVEKDADGTTPIYRLLKYLSSKYRLTFLVAGVYEYSGGMTFEQTNRQLDRWCQSIDSSNVHFLNNSDYNLSEHNINGNGNGNDKWVIIGSTMWPFIPPVFDIPPNFKFDYESIKGDNDRPASSMRDQNNWNKNDVKQLKTLIQSYSFTGENIIVLSHFAPTSNNSVFNDTNISKLKKSISWCKCELETLVDANSNLSYWCYANTNNNLMSGDGAVTKIQQMSLLTNQAYIKNDIKKLLDRFDSKLLSIDIKGLQLDKLEESDDSTDIPTTSSSESTSSISSSTTPTTATTETTTTTTVNNQSVLNIKNISERYQEKEQQNKQLLESIKSVFKEDESGGKSTDKLIEALLKSSGGGVGGSSMNKDEEEDQDSQKKRKFFNLDNKTKEVNSNSTKQSFDINDNGNNSNNKEKEIVYDDTDELESFLKSKDSSTKNNKINSNSNSNNNKDNKTIKKFRF
ncbi:hypothetical protein PPL_00932 [Heterostelium album PN500]|uniref:Calcineurin-like phosphoesterase domain-containing protein n=1 Tax=Heterostelium pallidum (strain ATCC 26659 / Pp 5 / PN500) TaxID=670386 RepID=D3AXM6_HETP5|nr:hypothetical protein PPL_00932 [Heterostelium album PN500]EFA85703.1 hypothetical protein PPL_00932 [Heterostelium album PN500]|eukprot:XP_020437809.1 hypothetical protein PPL_00932 [Heterostelium album PN500]